MSAAQRGGTAADGGGCGADGTPKAARGIERIANGRREKKMLHLRSGAKHKRSKERVIN